jgi:DNA recombination-dependent growth factor C
MKIFGHPWIESEKFNKVYSVEDINKASENVLVLLEPLVESIELAQYCYKNAIAYAIPVGSIKEAIFANELGANYMICKEENGFIIQPIAQQYLFDTEVLVLISDEKDISKLALQGIDGVIFADVIE